MPEITPFLLAGRAVTGEETWTISHPYDGRPVAEVAGATGAQGEEAVAAADAVRAEAAALPAHIRSAALDHVSQSLAARAEEVARLVTAENGKPLKWARLEVNRGISTFRWAAEEARRFGGEVQ